MIFQLRFIKKIPGTVFSSEKLLLLFQFLIKKIILIKYRAMLGFLNEISNILLPLTNSCRFGLMSDRCNSKMCV